jgi:hypothetical protein
MYIAVFAILWSNLLRLCGQTRPEIQNIDKQKEVISMSHAGSTGTLERSHIIMCDHPSATPSNDHDPRRYFTNFEIPFADPRMLFSYMYASIEGIESITFNRYSVVVAKGRLFEWDDIEDAFLLLLVKTMRIDPSDVLIKQVNGAEQDVSRLLRNSA